MSSPHTFIIVFYMSIFSQHNKTSHGSYFNYTIGGTFLLSVLVQNTLNAVFSEQNIQVFKSGNCFFICFFGTFFAYSVTVSKNNFRSI